MKKILYLIGFLLLSSFILSPQVSLPAFGQDATTPSAADPKCNSGSTYDDRQKCIPLSASRIFSKIENAMSGGKNWGETFGTDDPATAGQNMYLTIYDATINQPEIQAAKNITGRYGTTEAEMTQILSGNFAPILKKKLTLTQQDAFNTMAEIQNKFQEEKDLLQLEANISAAVEPSEIFTNGKISDSGFDLINDLSLIEEILFKKNTPIDVGGDFALSINANGDEKKPSGNQQKDAAKAANMQKKKTSDITKSQIAIDKNILDMLDENSKKDTPARPGYKADGSLDSTYCAPTGPVDVALENFEKNKSKDRRYQDTPTSEKDSQYDSDSQEIIPDGTSVLPPVTTTPSKAEAAPADNWLKDAPCTEVFCLSVNFVQKAPTAYKDSDNCISCHVEKINVKLKETIDHNLIPGKVTGNLIEPAMCKKSAITALSSVGLNFYAISKPVLTPRNDDLIYGTNIENEWKKFLATYKPFPFDEKNTKIYNASEALAPPREIERAASAAVANVAPNTTLQEVTQNIKDHLATTAKERAEAIKVATVAIKSDVQTGYYQGIIHEIDQMNTYFSLYRKILLSLHEPVEGMNGSQACTDIKNKKACD